MYFFYIRGLLFTRTKGSVLSYAIGIVFPSITPLNDFIYRNLSTLRFYFHKKTAWQYFLPPILTMLNG